MKRNVASQVIGAQMINATTGAAFTGSVTVYVTGDGGTQATGSVGSGACTHEGNGFHTYTPAQAETDYGHVAFTFIGTGAIPVTVQVYPSFPQTGDSFARLGAPAGASVSADIAAIEAQTDDIGVAGAGLTAVPWNPAWDAEVQSEAADALAAYDPPTKAELDSAVAPLATAANLATVAGYLDTEIGAIKAKTDNLPASPAAVGDAMTLTSGERTAIANEVEAQIIDDTDSEKVLEAITDKIAAVNPDLGGLTVGAIAAAVWSAATRVLTAGTNIVLAKGTGITGFNDLSAAQVNAEADQALADYDAPTKAEMDARTLPAADYATAADLATVDGVVDGIKLTTDKLDDTLEDDAGTFRFTTNALEQAPSGGGGGGLDAAGVRAAIGLASANLDTQLAALASLIDALPTNAELATALASADDAVLTAIANLHNLSSAQLASAIASGDDATLAQIALVLSAIAALHNLSSADVEAAAGAALATYDPPTLAELTAAIGAGDDPVLAVLALIKAKTDQLAFTKAGEVDANTQSINGATILGDGTPGNEFHV